MSLTGNILMYFTCFCLEFNLTTKSNYQSNICTAFLNNESVRKGFQFNLSNQLTVLNLVATCEPAHLPLPRRWRQSAWASIIWPALSMQPQPQSEVRLESGKGGKSILYVSHTLEAKSLRKASTFPMTESSPEASQQSSGGLSSSETNKPLAKHTKLMQ